MVQNLGFIVTFFDVLGHMFDCTIYPQTAEQAPLSSLRIKVPNKERSNTGFLPYLSDNAPRIGAPKNCASGYTPVKNPKIIMRVPVSTEADTRVVAFPRSNGAKIGIMIPIPIRSSSTTKKSVQISVRNARFPLASVFRDIA